MTLLVLEVTGDNTAAAEASFTLGSSLSFSSATLRAIELHAPGSQLVQDWSKAQTGDAAGGSRAVNSPLYVDLDGLVMKFQNVQRRLVQRARKLSVT